MPIRCRRSSNLGIDSASTGGTRPARVGPMRSATSEGGILCSAMPSEVDDGPFPDPTLVIPLVFSEAATLLLEALNRPGSAHDPG